MPRTYNLAVRRELALAVDGFPDMFYGEDIEFSERVAGLGAGLRFLPDAVVIHDERRSAWATAVASFRKGFNRVETTRRCGMPNVLYSAPAGLIALFAAWAVLAVAGSPLSAPAGIPLLAYAAAMAALGLYGCFAMREPIAAAAVPFYAVLIHAAYGLGYSAALATLVARRVWSARKKPSAAPPGVAIARGGRDG